MPIRGHGDPVRLSVVSYRRRGERLVSVIGDLMHALFGVVRTVMYVAQVVRFGANAFTIGKCGFGILVSLGQLDPLS